MPAIKEKLRALLEASDWDGLTRLAGEEPSAIRHLISMTYDRAEPICWRAIEAIGLVSSRMDAEGARMLAQRVLWMMRDESGGNAWSAPDMLGEIVRAHPAKLEDIAPVIGSFHDEPIFTSGVLRALGRVAEVNPGLVLPEKEMIESHLKDADPAVRACAAYALGYAGNGNSASKLEGLRNDSCELYFYEEGKLSRTTVGSIAGKALGRILTKSN